VELIKSILKLHFTAAARPWLEMRDLLRVAGGDPKLELQASTLVVDRAKTKERVTIEVRALTLELEAPATSEQHAKTALDLMTRMHEASNFPTLAEIRYESIFIRPYPLPFHELLSLVKERFLRSSPVADAATDVGLVFDQHEADTVKNVVLGPMAPAQLKSQYLRWERERIPDTFLFLGVAHTSRKETPFSADLLKEALTAAIAWQEEQVTTIASHLQGRDD
jgi:hypothetical protein